MDEWTSADFPTAADDLPATADFSTAAVDLPTTVDGYSTVDFTSTKSNCKFFLFISARTHDKAVLISFKMIIILFLSVCSG